MRVYLETYGCTANKADSELILAQLLQSGVEVVSSSEEADVVILNTCAVKGVTYRRMISRIAKLRESGKRVVVGGCLPLIDPKVVDSLDAFSCRSITKIPELIARIRGGERGIKLLFDSPVEKPLLPFVSSSRISAIVQIAEGCLSNCSYCSVKLARGRLHSFRPESVERRVRKAVEDGAKEILLTAQDTAAYGRDIGTDLPALLNRLTKIEGEFKIRVGMMNPANVSPLLDELIQSFDDEKIYKFLHLPVQSGDNDVLQGMRRGYTVEDFEFIVKSFRARFEDLQLVTDIIVGFPTETQEAFENTVKLLQRIKPDKVNLSRFSPMPNTEASRMKCLNSQIIAERSKIVSELCRRIGLEVNSKYVGRKETVVVIETGPRGGFLCRMFNYKPVIIPEGKLGEKVEVLIERAESTYLWGRKL